MTTGCGPGDRGARRTPTIRPFSKGISTLRPGGSRCGQRVHQASHSPLMGAAHLEDVVDPEKLGEVVVDGSLAEMTARPSGSTPCARAFRPSDS